jgi:hypothetical protein
METQGEKFNVKVGTYYEFRLTNASLAGRLQYYLSHAGLMEWLAVIGVLLGLLALVGYTMKDLIGNPRP